MGSINGRDYHSRTTKAKHSRESQHMKKKRRIVTITSRKKHKKAICQVCGGKLKRISPQLDIFYCEGVNGQKCGLEYFYDRDEGTYKIIMKLEKEWEDESISI